MPVLALLLMVDLALALLGRLNQQLQLLILAFPIKMMAALGLLATMAALFPRVYRGYAEQVLARVATVAGF
jgi:flagellar biosynthesis protein FliR